MEERLKAKLLEFIALESADALPKRNRMGCSEQWYNPLYSITHTFASGEIEQMTEEELQHLYRLANSIADAFY